MCLSVMWFTCVHVFVCDMHTHLYSARPCTLSLAFLKTGSCLSFKISSFHLLNKIA